MRYCRRGHEMVPGNVKVMRSKGRRIETCRMCYRESRKEIVRKQRLKKAGGVVESRPVVSRPVVAKVAEDLKRVVSSVGSLLCQVCKRQVRFGLQPRPGCEACREMIRDANREGKCGGSGVSAGDVGHADGLGRTEAPGAGCGDGHDEVASEDADREAGGVSGQAFGHAEGVSSGEGSVGGVEGGTGEAGKDGEGEPGSASEECPF